MHVKHPLPRSCQGRLALCLMAAGLIGFSLAAPGSVQAETRFGGNYLNGDETAEERARRERIEQLQSEIAPVVREARAAVAATYFPRRMEQADLDRYQATLDKIQELRQLMSGEDGYYSSYADAAKIREAMNLMRQEMTVNPVHDEAHSAKPFTYIFSALTGAALSQVAGEIGKATQVKRSVEESLATYKLQEALRKNAADLGDALTPMDTACTNLTSGDQVTTVSGTPSHYALVNNSQFIESINADYGNKRKTILASYDEGVKKYCTAYDARMGKCSTSAAAFPGGDIMATTLLGSEGSGEGTSETYVAGQVDAADAYINRIVSTKSIPEPLPVSCETPQCKAYNELRAQSIARMLAARSSLATIAGRRTSVVDMPKAEGVTEPAMGLAGK